MSSLTALAGRRQRDERRTRPWQAELDALGALLAESRFRASEHELRGRIAAILAEEAGDRIGAAAASRIAERVASAVAQPDLSRKSAAR